jgi:hypothetical protein
VGKIDSTVPGYISKYTLTIDDIWRVKVKSLGDVGCTMMHSLSQQLYIFVLFDGTQVQISTSVYSADLPSELDPYKAVFLYNNTYLSSDCKVLSVNGNNYYLSNTLNLLNTPSGSYNNNSMSIFGDNFYFFLNSTKALYKHNFASNLPKDQYLLPYADSTYLGCILSHY